MDDLARQQPGPGADVEDTHARPQSRAIERLAPVALAGAERHDAACAVVVFRRSIEQRVDDTLPIVGARPIAGFSGQRWLIHGHACGSRAAERPAPTAAGEPSGRTAQPRRESRATAANSRRRPRPANGTSGVAVPRRKTDRGTRPCRTRARSGGTSGSARAGAARSGGTAGPT